LAAARICPARATLKKIRTSSQFKVAPPFYYSTAWGSLSAYFVVSIINIRGITQMLHLVRCKGEGHLLALI
jgi:hypothetical protein